MPFDTDNSCPAGLIVIFEHARTLERPVPQSSLEDQYYGPYNKMLNCCFSGNFDFVVAPQAPSYYDRDALPTSSASSYSTSNRSLSSSSRSNTPRLTFVSRPNAKKQLNHAFPVPKFYGLSVFGTNMRVYCCDSGEISPWVVPNDSNQILPNEHLENRWSVDILSDKGFSEMKRIVNYIKEESTILKYMKAEQDAKQTGHAVSISTGIVLGNIYISRCDGEGISCTYTKPNFQTSRRSRK
ncbi:hypothetical protein K438DRAFT_2134248 [Mycena galopus ATCC 62051]|nr:hypothetical protein K438DRAFT_2134248 [Mycena galopus ATCC 62051]